MFDSRWYCPQRGSDQVKYQAPKAVLGAFVLMIGSIVATFGLLMLAMMFKLALVESALNLAELLIVLVIPGTGILFFMMLRHSLKADRLDFKCKQCACHWTISKEEWRQAGDAPVQTKTLSPQEKQEKRAAVESLINQIKKM